MGKSVLAEVLQTPKWRKGRLQKFCKRQNGENGFCRTSANVKKEKMAFAGLLQAPKRRKWPLQECCKCREKLFGVCRDAASAPKNYLEFAGMLQMPRKTVWRLQHCCKHFQKHFSRYSTLSETSYWNKKPHPCIEHTFRRGVESKTKRIPQAHRHF